MGFCWIKQKKFYSSDDIQAMLNFISHHDDRPEYHAFLNYISKNTTDTGAIKHCISEGWYEEFDRYDSDVCEQFIRCFEKFFITNKKFNTLNLSSQFIVVAQNHRDQYGVVDIEDYEIEYYPAEKLVELVTNGVCSIAGVYPDGKIEIIY